MPRQPRVVVVDYPHHVTQRGNNREPVFLDRQDYLKYLELLKFFTAKHQVQVLSFCLMPNHVHLLVIPGVQEGLSSGIGTTNLTYTQYFNKKYSRSGRIWQSRFFSCVVGRDDYLWNLLQYIEMNPVKAGLTKEAILYEWSSAKARRGGEINSLLTCPESLDLPFMKASSQPDESICEQIRKTTRTGGYFGCSESRAALENEMNIKLTPRPRGRPKRK